MNIETGSPARPTRIVENLTVKLDAQQLIHSVAKKGVVTTEEIERMLKDASKEYLKAKPSELKRLGIDEIALIKGKGNYYAVLMGLKQKSSPNRASNSFCKQQTRPNSD